MMQRLCHVTSVHPANDIRIYHKECLSLLAAGYQVHLVALAAVESAEISPVILHAMPAASKGGRVRRIIFRAWQAYKLAKAVNAQIYHIHDPELLPYGLLLTWQGHTVIYDAHEDLPRDILIKAWIPRFVRKPLAFLVEAMENFIVRRLAQVVAATPFIAERFRTVGAKVTEINNFPRLGELSFDLKNTSVSQDEQPSFCYVGLLSLERGLLEMIHAIDAFELKLILAGAFSSKDVEQRARVLTGWSKVEYHRHLSRPEVAKVYARSQVGFCLLHPTATYIHSLPIKLFEYMSAGLPVLASNFSLWRQIIEENNSGLCVDPLKVESIQQGIQSLLADPTRRKIMGENGKSVVKQHYNWQSEEQKLLKMYQQLGAAPALRESAR